MLFRNISLLLGFVILGCATSTEVHMEDGSTAHDVSCYGGRFACSDEASRLCGGRPYTVLDEDTGLEMLSRSRQGSVRIQCNDDWLAAHTTPPPSPSQKPKEGAACSAAYREIGSLSMAWGRVRGGTPKTEATPRDGFMKTCTTIPEKAQMCLVSVYRKAHPECPKVLGELDEATRARLDAVLLAPNEPNEDEGDSVPLVGPGGTMNL